MREVLTVFGEILEKNVIIIFELLPFFSSPEPKAHR